MDELCPEVEKRYSWLDKILYDATFGWLRDGVGIWVEGFVLITAFQKRDHVSY